jgi:hypothetical protein
MHTDVRQLARQLGQNAVLTTFYLKDYVKNIISFVKNIIH